MSGPSYPGPLGAAVTRLTPLMGNILVGAAPSGPGLDPVAEHHVHEYLVTVTDEATAEVGDYGSALARLGVLQARADEIHALSSGDPERTAVALLRDGLSRAVQLEPVLPPLTKLDSHVDNQGNQERCLEASFAGLLTLLDLLSDAPGETGGSLLDETLVLSMSEMGRAPVVNGSGGKDHWPYTSAMLVGGGLSGGRVLGGTDESQVGRLVDLSTGAPLDGGESLSSAAFLAGVLGLLGADLSPWVPGVTPLSAL